MRQDAAAGGKVIVDPLSGERIIIRCQPGHPGGVLAWELQLAPGGRVPASHAHPGQEERFTVVEGRMRFRVGWRRLVAGPGQTVRVPPGTVHHFANAGPGPALVRVTTVPPLSMAGLLETAAAMARDQQAAGRVLPRLTDLMMFMRDFEGGAGAVSAAPAGPPGRPVAVLARGQARAGRTLPPPPDGQPGPQCLGV